MLKDSALLLDNLLDTTDHNLNNRVIEILNLKKEIMWYCNAPPTDFGSLLLTFLCCCVTTDSSGWHGVRACARRIIQKGHFLLQVMDVPLCSTDNPLIQLTRIERVVNRLFQLGVKMMMNNHLRQFG